MIEQGFKIEGFEAITSQQMYRIENNGEIKLGMKKVLMMENAGNRISDHLLEKFKEGIFNKKIIAVSGMGNNGGDAMVAIRHLSGYIMSKVPKMKNDNIVICLLGKPSQLKTIESITNWNIIKNMDSVKKIDMDKNSAEEIANEISTSDIIIDGLFGTGIKGNIKEPFSSMIDTINQQRSKSYILSVDIPSGMDPDTGEILDKSIKADTTITFHRIKHGILKNQEFCGDILPVKIGIPHEAEIGEI